jgi:hypothetical protein
MSAGWCGINAVVVVFKKLWLPSGEHEASRYAKCFAGFRTRQNHGAPVYSDLKAFQRRCRGDLYVIGVASRNGI